MDEPRELPFTGSELAILRLLGTGHSVQEMARLLRLSPRTVENRKWRVYRKLGADNQYQAVSKAISLGLLDRPVPPGTPPVEGVNVRRSAVAKGRGRMIVVLAGPEADPDVVVQALIRLRAPFLVTKVPELGDDFWLWAERSTITVILVDPTPGDWILPVRLSEPVLAVLSASPSLWPMVDALRHGAHALIWQDDVLDDLGAVLALVERGYLAMSGIDLDDLASHLRLPTLTARERDVLGSIAGGHTIRQCARLLGIAPKTVESTQARLFQKLSAKNRSEALTIAYRLGLVGRGVGTKQEPRPGLAITPHEVDPERRPGPLTGTTPR